jgi:hypothetical protein
MVTMNRQKVQQIIAGLPLSLAGIRTAISGKIEREFASATEVPKFRFPVHESLMTRAAYDHFRTTDWLLNAGPDIYWGPGMQVAVLRQKVLVYPEFCFHATEATKLQDILKYNGLYPGNRVGQSPRYPTFCDSVHYIFAALTSEEAATWVERLADRGDFRIYKVRVEGFGLVPDPCAGMVDGRPDGYILNTDHVPLSLIGESDLLRRT